MIWQQQLLERIFWIRRFKKEIKKSFRLFFTHSQANDYFQNLYILLP